MTRSHYVISVCRRCSARFEFPIAVGRITDYCEPCQRQLGARLSPDRIRHLNSNWAFERDVLRRERPVARAFVGPRFHGFTLS